MEAMRGGREGREGGRGGREGRGVGLILTACRSWINFLIAGG